MDPSAPVWMPLTPLSHTTTPSGGKRMGLMAPVGSISDIVDAFAIVDFLKHSCHVVSAYDILRPVEVVTTQDKFNGRVSNWILFTTESNSFPVDKTSGTLFSIHGSPFAFSVVEGDPPNVTHSYKLPNCNASSIDDIHIAAARVAATLVDEFLDSKEATSSFVDAVSSRFKYFTRVRLGVTLEDATSARVPARPKPLSQDERKHLKPFKKPQFKHLDDLLWAFATHTVGGNADTQIPVTGDLDAAVPGPKFLQPLVFCHTLGKDS